MGASLLEPAHVTLAYPWIPAVEVPARLPDVRSVAAGAGAFEVVLEGPFRFDVDVRGRQVVHLRPVSDEPFHALAAALGVEVRTPHLSIARVTSAGSPEEVEDAVRPLLPLRTTISQLEVTVRDAPGVWTRALLADLSPGVS